MIEIKLTSAIFCLVLSLSLLILPGVAAGLEVQTSIGIIGVGVIDREVAANTEVGLVGIKYTEHFYTQSLGRYGLSKVNYTSDFAFVANNRKNSTINADFIFELSNIYQSASVRDYELRSRQSFWTRGNTEAAVMFTVDNHSSSFDLAQEMTGAGGYCLLARNRTDWHTKEYADTAEYNGTYGLIISSFFGEPYYPAAGIEDWLLCPGDEKAGSYIIVEP